MAQKRIRYLSVANIREVAAAIPRNEDWIRDKAYYIWEERVGHEIPGDADDDWMQAVLAWDMRVERTIIESYVTECANPQEKIRCLVIFMVALFQMVKPTEVEGSTGLVVGTRVDKRFVLRMICFTMSGVMKCNFVVPASARTVKELVADLVRQYAAHSRPRKKIKKSGRTKKRS